MWGDKGGAHEGLWGGGYLGAWVCVSTHGCVHGCL